MPNRIIRYQKVRQRNEQRNTPHLQSLGQFVARLHQECVGDSSATSSTLPYVILPLRMQYRGLSQGVYLRPNPIDNLLLAGAIVSSVRNTPLR